MASSKANRSSGAAKWPADYASAASRNIDSAIMKHLNVAQPNEAIWWSCDTDYYQTYPFFLQSLHQVALGLYAAGVVMVGVSFQSTMGAVFLRQEGRGYLVSGKVFQSRRLQVSIPF
ncbi:hypothetical protein NQZ68_001267 [Dissostichus eleginoides]|nr:hypothetical protein NQZ68_001267 [Dissostichus eleginoides]